MAGTSGSRSVDSRDKPLYKSLCLGWKIRQAPHMEKHCLWEFTARTPAAGLGFFPKVLPALQRGQKGSHSPLVHLLRTDVIAVT